MAAQVPNLPSFTPEASEGSVRDLFSDLIEGGGARPGVTSKALPISLVAHVFVILAAVLVPIFSTDDPTPQNAIRALLINPPPPPPPPLSLGSPLAKPQPVQPKPETEPERATPKPQTQFVVPQEPKPIEPERAPAVPDQAGSPEGSEGGDPDGMIGGVAGGTVGGVLGGTIGGQIGGTGTGPIADYDEPPRPIRITKPVVPQDAFVKQIQGRVEVEILIDENGRVTRARITRSIPALDQAALDCVHGWIFQPARKHGRPVAVLSIADVDFRYL
jgi:periplasmic protein TonB